jgi:Asp-tRNA(Asn)/Glu-tRNA(Gln) amidotransferase A subunit family amidase
MSWSEWGKLDATAIGFPAISLSAGLLKSGLPCGSQLQGRWGDDGATMVGSCKSQLKSNEPSLSGFV